MRQDVVVGYWEQLMRERSGGAPGIDRCADARFDVPCLAVFGRALTEGERERFERLPDFQLEEWAGDGHCVHLVEPDRFAARLSRFIDDCA